MLWVLWKSRTRFQCWLIYQGILDRSLLHPRCLPRWLLGFEATLQIEVWDYPESCKFNPFYLFLCENIMLVIINKEKTVIILNRKKNIFFLMKSIFFVLFCICNIILQAPNVLYKFPIILLVSSRHLSKPLQRRYIRFSEQIPETVLYAMKKSTVIASWPFPAREEACDL